MNKKQADKKEKLNKFYELEIQNVFSTMIDVQNFRIQSGIFFATANLGALSLAITTTTSVIFFIAASLLFIFMWIDIRGRSVLAGFNNRAIQLQKRFAPDDNETFLNIIVLGIFDNHLQKINNLPSSKKRLKAIRKLPVIHPGITSFWIPITLGIFEICLGILTYIYGWDIIRL